MKRMRPFYESIPEYAGAGVYCIRNLETGACYIGASKHIRARLSEHASFVRSGKGNKGLSYSFLLGQPLVAEVLVQMQQPSTFELREHERLEISRAKQAGVQLMNDAPVPPGKIWYDRLLAIAFQRGDTDQIKSLADDMERFSKRGARSCEYSAKKAPN